MTRRRPRKLDPESMTERQAIAYLGIGWRWFRAASFRGEFPAHRVRWPPGARTAARWRQADLDAWAASLTRRRRRAEGVETPEVSEARAEG